MDTDLYYDNCKTKILHTNYVLLVVQNTNLKKLRVVILIQYSSTVRVSQRLLKFWKNFMEQDIVIIIVMGEQ